MRKFLNAFLCLGIVFVAGSSYSSLASYWLYAGGVIVWTGVTDFFYLNGLVWKKKDYLTILVPVVFLVGLFGTMAGISSPGAKLFLGILSAGWFYLYQVNFPKFVPRFVEEVVLLSSAFFNFLFIWSINFFFSPPGFVLMLAMFVFGSLIFLPIYHKTPVLNVNPHVAVLISSLVLVEASWALLYWPAHYVTMSIVTFFIFYGFYIFSKFYFERRLTRSRVYFYLTLILILLVLSLASSPWTI